MLLLAYQWTSGPIPKDPIRLGRMAGYGDAGFRKLWKTVGRKFVDADAQADGAAALINTRLEEHRERSKQLSQKRADIGRKGGEAKAAGQPKYTAKPVAIATGLLKQISTIHPIPSHPLPTSPTAPLSDLRESGADFTRMDADPAADFEAFCDVRRAYPEFSGRQDWLQAEHFALARIERDGVSWDQLRAGVRRYADYCAAGGVSGPQYVMTPAKFFSAPDQPWAQAWAPPPTKAQASQTANVDASTKWLHDQERRDAAG